MNRAERRNMDQKVNKVLPRIKLLIERAKEDWLFGTGRLMHPIDSDEADINEILWISASMWVCTVEAGGTHEEADLLIQSSFMLSSFMDEKAAKSSMNNTARP